MSMNDNTMEYSEGSSSYILDALRFLYEQDKTLWELAYDFYYSLYRNALAVRTHTYGSTSDSEPVIVYISRSRIEEWKMTIVKDSSFNQTHTTDYIFSREE